MKDIEKAFQEIEELLDKRAALIGRLNKIGAKIYEETEERKPAGVVTKL